MPVWSKLRPEYDRLWEGLEILPSRRAAVESTARKILTGKTRYLAVEQATTVPWYVVGIIHAMECGLSWLKHLHNGDSLKKRTWQVPAGRPKFEPSKGWGVGYTWEESAIDAIRYDGLDKVGDWSIERIAYELEGYNGWGYRNHHPEVKSPYLWSFTNRYSRGKYVKDGVWDARAVSGQSGAMAILLVLMELDSSIRPVDLPKTGGPAPVTPGMIGAIQERLKILNYPVGMVDGRMGNRTRDAIAAYQMDHGIPSDGKPSESLLSHMQTEGLPRPVSSVRADAAEAPGTDVEKALEVAGKVAVGVGGAAGAAKTAEGTGALDKAAEKIETVRTVSNGLREILETLGDYWWVGALAIGAFVAYKAFKARERRLERFRAGLED